MSEKKEAMTAELRREYILNILGDKPENATALGILTGVSRQVIVQDIAILKAQGNPIVSTNRGYIITGEKTFSKVMKVFHKEEEIAEEMNIILDNGGTIKDVIISHRVYGQIVGELNITNKVQAAEFIRSIEAGKSRPLMTVTEGYHYHTITADSEEALERIQNELDARGFLLKE